MNGTGWDGMGWNGMEWDGMEWNGMGWDGLYLDQRTFQTGILAQVACPVGRIYSESPTSVIFIQTNSVGTA